MQDTGRRIISHLLNWVLGSPTWTCFSSHLTPLTFSRAFTRACTPTTQPCRPLWLWQVPPCGATYGIIPTTCTPCTTPCAPWTLPASSFSSPSSCLSPCGSAWTASWNSLKTLSGPWVISPTSSESNYLVHMTMPSWNNVWIWWRRTDKTMRNC